MRDPIIIKCGHFETFLSYFFFQIMVSCKLLKHWKKGTHIMVPFHGKCDKHKSTFEWPDFVSEVSSWKGCWVGSGKIDLRPAAMADILKERKFKFLGVYSSPWFWQCSNSLETFWPKAQISGSTQDRVLASFSKVCGSSFSQVTFHYSYSLIWSFSFDSNR